MFNTTNIFLPRHQYELHQLSFSEMEAQLQEQQSRDKEIKAVNETQNKFLLILNFVSSCLVTQAAAGLSKEKLEEYMSIFSFFDRCLLAQNR